MGSFVQVLGFSGRCECEKIQYIVAILAGAIHHQFEGLTPGLWNFFFEGELQFFQFYSLQETQFTFQYSSFLLTISRCMLVIWGNRG